MPPRKLAKSTPIPRLLKIDGEQEPEEVEVFDPPKTLNKVGKAKWIEFSSILATEKRMSKQFIPALTHLCEICEQYDQINREIGTGKLLVDTSYGPKANPLVFMRTQVAGQIRQMMCDFGLTPHSAKAAGSTGKVGKSSVAKRDRSTKPA